MSEHQYESSTSVPFGRGVFEDGAPEALGKTLDATVAPDARGGEDFVVDTLDDAALDDVSVGAAAPVKDDDGDDAGLVAVTVVGTASDEPRPADDFSFGHTTNAATTPTTPMTSNDMGTTQEGAGLADETGWIDGSSLRTSVGAV